MGYLSNLKKQYFITLFNALIPAYVIERLFWQQRGMNVQMVVYCEIIYALTVTLLEIPSGILSDRFGRKRLLAVTGALSAVEFLILMFADGFWMFGLAVFLSGIGKAFSSGSQNALLYDTLLTEHREGEFEKLLGRLSAIDLTGSIAAALSGGVLASFFGFEFNYLLSFFSMSAAFFITITLKEPPMETRPEGELSSARQYAKQAVSLFRSKPLVFHYCLSGAVLGACLIYLDEFFQLVLDGVGIPVFLFGVAVAFNQALQIPGNLFAYKLKGRFQYQTLLTGLILVNLLGYLAIFLTRNPLCLIPMFAVSLAAGITEPLIAGYLHHHTKSEIRATVESFYSLGMRFLSTLVGLAFAFFSTRFSIFYGFATLAVICGGYFIFIIIRRLAHFR